VPMLATGSIENPASIGFGAFRGLTARWHLGTIGRDTSALDTLNGYRSIKGRYDGQTTETEGPIERDLQEF
jgi:hypothetical protein